MHSNRFLSYRVTHLLLLLCWLVLQAGTARAISIGQIDDFEDTTLQNWHKGSVLSTAENMGNVFTGGPAGLGDNYLGTIGDGHHLDDGGRITILNRTQWTGDYLAAGVTAIEMGLNDFESADLLGSSVPLYIRLGLRGDGGLFSTSTRFTLNSGSGWLHAVFPILPGDLTAVSGRSGVPGFDALATLGNVTELRLIHSAVADWSGTPVVAYVGVDNISPVSTVPLPPAVWLFGSGLGGLLAFRQRYRNSGEQGQNEN